MLESPLHISHDARIHPQGNALTIEGFAGQIAQGRQLFRQRAIFIEQLLEAVHRLRVRIDIHPTVVAVDHQSLVLKACVGQVGGAHHGRHAHTARHNGCVTVGRAA